MKIDAPVKPYKKTQSKTWGKMVELWQLYLLLLLPLIYLVTFAYIPMFGVQIAFKEYSPHLGIWGSPWAGMKYFAKFFSSYQFNRVLRNTLIVAVYNLAANFPLSVMLALALNCVKRAKYKSLIQTVTYIPHFISTVVIVGMMMQIFNPLMGTYANVFKAVFGSEAPNIMGNPNAFYHMYVWSGVWQNMGWNSIIYLAALSAVDTELYEAASVDGASRFHMVWKIDIPSIMPTIVIMLILQCGRIMSIEYEKALLMQNSFNIKYSEIISTFVYRQGFAGNSNYSYATAIGLFNSVINLILIGSVNGFSRKVSENSLW